MSYRKAKTAPKIFETDRGEIKYIVLKAMKRISDIVGGTLGPCGKLVLLESDLPNVSNACSKDGVTVFSKIGSMDSYEHLIIETARDSSQRTATEAGDGTTTTAILAYSLIDNIFDYCEKNPKQSPQKTIRKIRKYLDSSLLPYIQSRTIKVGEDNKTLLTMVATISANGDKELANAVIQCFEEVGFGESSHVTIREVPGPSGYKVERIEGFPIPIGFEETSGKYFTSFVNDTGNQRCYLEKPKFILFDGTMNDFTQIGPLLNSIGERYQKGDKNYENIVVVANGFSEHVISTFAYNFGVAGTPNIVPLLSPMAQFVNCQSHHLMDLSAFTGAKVFGMNQQIDQATLDDLGNGMTSFECNRFRSTVIGEPEPLNIEARAEQIRLMKKKAESRAEEVWFDERLGKITNGIAKLTISGGSMGEIKERVDRADDAICAVRSTIAHGCLPGGCRIAIDMTLKIAEELEEHDSVREILLPSLLSLPERLLDNAGYNSDEIKEVISQLVEDPNLVYDVENQVFGDAMTLGLFDATKAVSESLNNAVSISGVLGTLGGIVCHPRDQVFERDEAKKDEEFRRVTENPDAFDNPVLERRKGRG